MAEWRISDVAPIRELEGLDHERCAALHNHIVELGWTQRGLALDTLDKRTWWECYGGDAALSSTAERLDASVVSFLKASWHGFAMDSATQPHLFHRYLARLCSPEELWQNANYSEEEDDSNKRRYITLYMANWALGATHPLGLVLDQDEFTAMQHMSMRDTEITMNGRQMWLPLEMVLDGFVDMIDQGKIMAVDENNSGEQERTEPWIMPSYTEPDLEDTLQAFEQLLDAIHVRMPYQEQSAEQNLLEVVTGGNPGILSPNSFAHRFLTQCSRPNFTHIAPGLSITQQQPFAPTPGQANENKLFPLLLFTSTSPAHQETQRTPWGERIRASPFAHDFDDISTYPAGLYLTETNPHSSHPFEDGCKLILPFTLGSNAFARTSDGALIGENVRKAGEDASAEIEPKSAELYQLGFNHFIAGHDVQLRYVLCKWMEMIEEGKWEVDEHGVAGGIEKWSETDLEEHWSDYQLPMSW
ncbi:hypothetical protein BU24DRAFT_403009 [Aaosphaeria arxii CBS 175.79]|uniref:Uncharacterized protein n=1 Tax=Aaosphaeria arxii CBS 175.79 TaxID=1450172 RepID=A0A6A5X677_9PLEO|nr:uncharacterized protein BU24DRAFT_403009 [Aaosphaeria arxii CBS 175.79]KAF2008422.1 hypothetical protein BU24DRAFT_403009 [Aaosphaeria arxii CBS 175.79]